MSTEVEAAIARLRCCASPDIGSEWAYGVSGPDGGLPDHVILRVSRIHCKNCGTDYELRTEPCPVEQVQRDALAFRIEPVRRRPS